jgi:hypothetical protein
METKKVNKVNPLVVILFIYSALASVFLTVSGIINSKSSTPITFQLFFLPITAYFLVEIIVSIRNMIQKRGVEESEFRIKPRKGEIVSLVIILIVLTLLGVKSMQKAGIRGSSPSQTAFPQSSPMVFPKAKIEAKKIEIVITDGSKSVNIRQTPNINGKAIGEAFNGEIYTLIETANGWSQIELKDGNTGYIYAKYIREVTNQ